MLTHEGNIIIDQLHRTKLWKHISKKNIKNLTLIDDKVSYAANMLLLIRDTFPTYTKHDHTHSFNVIRIAEELLGENLQKISEFNVVLILLASFFHDIGMVLSDVNKNSLTKEKYYHEFIKNSTYMQMLLKISNEMPDNIFTLYCRQTHHLRCESYIADDFVWNGYEFSGELIALCKSHGFSLEEADKEFSKLVTPSVLEADLMFCAIILRLADCLDFDSSRAPIEIFNYLNINDTDSYDKQISNTEWRKHIGSLGFSFPKKKADAYSIEYNAVFSNIEIEHSTRNYLNYVQSEMNACNLAMRYLTEKYKKFSLPSTIVRKIKSNGYTYGNFILSIDREKVIRLVIGENLYTNKDVFVRELLQNAMDTVRFRRNFEQNHGDYNYEPTIYIYSWHDEEHNLWFRIDDNGMGMNLSIIEEYLLNVGNSYYQSDEFNLLNKSINTRLKEHFVPISRYGIGILSCFLACDHIEINTHYRHNHIYYDKSIKSDDCIRMSMTGINGYYTINMKKSGHAAMNMPNNLNTNEGYRDDYGTSVAVKICNGKGFDFKAILNSLVVFPDVCIKYNGARLCEEKADLLQQIEKKPIYSLQMTKKQINQIEKTIHAKFETLPIFNFRFLNLTKYADDINLNGIFLIESFDIHIKTIDEHEDSKIERRISPNINDNGDIYIYYYYEDKILYWEERAKKESLEYENMKLERKVTKCTNEEEKSELLRRIDDIKKELKEIKNRYFDYEQKGKISFGSISNYGIPGINYYFELDKKEHERNTIVYSYNNIRLPIYHHRMFGDRFKNKCVYGIVSLSDTLSPKVSVDRNRIISYNWNTISKINLAFKKMILKELSENEYIYFLRDALINDINYENIFEAYNDPYITISDDKGWGAIPLFTYDKYIYSAQTYMHNLNNKKKREYVCFRNDEYNWQNDFMINCKLAILQSQFNISIMLSDKYLNPFYTTFILSKREYDDIPFLYKQFPPVFFVNYQNSKLLKYAYAPYNAQHEFIKWLKENSVFLANNYKNEFTSLKELLTKARWHVKEGVYKTIISEINELLNKLRMKMTIPEEIYLKENDIGGHININNVWSY